MPKSASSRPAGNGGASRLPLTKCRSATGIAPARPGRTSAADGIVVLRCGSGIAVSYNAARMLELKSDLFGTVTLGGERGRDIVVRDTAPARWWTGWIARLLCRREARALARLDGLHGTPRLLAAGRGTLIREWIEGRPMQVARPRNPEYYRA